MKNLTLNRNIFTAVLVMLSGFISQSAGAATVWDGITTAVTQPLTDALTVIVAIAGLMAVLFIGWRVSKMLLAFVRG
jgi:hypothetical protein